MVKCYDQFRGDWCVNHHRGKTLREEEKSKPSHTVHVFYNLCTACTMRYNNYINEWFKLAQTVGQREPTFCASAHIWLCSVCKLYILPRTKI